MSKDKKSKRSRSPSESRNSRGVDKDDSRREKDSKGRRLKDKDDKRFYDRDSDRKRSRSKSPEFKRRRSRSRSRDRYEKKSNKTVPPSTSSKSVEASSTNVVSTVSTAVELNAEKRREAERQAENDALEEEMRKRRERVKAWQQAKATMNSTVSTDDFDKKSSDKVVVTTADHQIHSVEYNHIDNVQIQSEKDIGESTNMVLDHTVDSTDSKNDLLLLQEETTVDTKHHGWTLEDEDDDDEDDDKNEVKNHDTINTTSIHQSDLNTVIAESLAVLNDDSIQLIAHDINNEEDEEVTGFPMAKSHPHKSITVSISVGHDKDKDKTNHSCTTTTNTTIQSNATDRDHSLNDTSIGTDMTMTMTTVSSTQNDMSDDDNNKDIIESKLEDNIVISNNKDPVGSVTSPIHTTKTITHQSPIATSITSATTNTATTTDKQSTKTTTPSKLDMKPNITKTATTTTTTTSVNNTTTTITTKDDDDDEDPLDAFMKSLFQNNDPDTYSVSESVTGGYGDLSTTTLGPASLSTKMKTIESLNSNIFNRGTSSSINTSVQQNVTTAKYITLEDLMGSSSNSTSMLSTQSVPRQRAGWESDVPSSPSRVGDQLQEEEDEKEEQARREFMEALRKASSNLMVEDTTMTTTTTEKTVSSNITQVAINAATTTTTTTSTTPQKDVTAITITTTQVKKEEKESLGRLFNHEGDVIDEQALIEKKKSALELLEDAKKGKELKPVNHALIEYIPIRKNLYIVPKILSKLSESEIKEKREDLQIKVRGKMCPVPVDTWQQCGLSDRLLATLNKYNLEAPFAIQKQAIPAIMCGRDVIAIAKTGSGKTLAFLLPLFRHIQDQPPLKHGEGPIGLIMAPARELALQISREAKKFATSLGLSVACIYGGAGVAEQIGELKRGADIVVCTPGRMIDILCMQAGKLVSLKRVSYVVMDEADRMFDMGFEPQIKMILQNIRPDRQTVLFSATFPKQIENAARTILKTPLEIIVGERSTVNKDITQIIEVHDEDDKFMRLLQLLGIWYEKGSILIFVDKQEKCDQLFHDLLKSGYPCLSLHGGHEQVDRDHTLYEFRTQIKTVLVATSAASRGLDIPEIVVVINYNCPNHLEEYVHRVGRTGRAGRKGTAYTFISPSEEQYSPIMLRALEKAEQTIPDELNDMVKGFKEKVSRGEAKYSHTGFGGEGYTFDATEMSESQKIAHMQRRQYEIEQGIINDKDEVDDLGEDDEMEGPFITTTGSGMSAIAAASSSSSSSSSSMIPGLGTSTTTTLPPGILAPESAAFQALAPIEKAHMMVKYLAYKNTLPGAPPPTLVQPAIPVTPPTGPIDPNIALARARMIAQQMSSKGLMMSEATDATGTVQQQFSDEIEINDYPPVARRKVTQRTSMDEIAERAGVTVISRGSYIPPGKKPELGERKLYLLIEGSSEMAVKFAKMEILRSLEEETLKLGASNSTASFGRYSVT